MAVVVLWKVYKRHPQMYLPPELIAIILQSVVAPSKPLSSHNHANSDLENESGSEYTDDSESEDQEDEDQYTEDDQDQESDRDDERNESDDHSSSEVENNV